MISIVLYGRNDNYGYNLHKRAALSLNCMAEVLTDPSDEILFVDYNTSDDFPTFPEAIRDTLTSHARKLLRIFRVRPRVHERFKAATHLLALEPIARNVGVRRSSAANRWVLSTNTDLIFVLQHGRSLSEIARGLGAGFYHAPRIEIPEALWESLDRSDPTSVIETVREWGGTLHLNEIVMGMKLIRYDGPGDFQLILRDDLFEFHGFNEQMLLGWHVDSNIAARMFLKYGEVGDLGGEVFGYHCDHTRQATPMHSHRRVENDWKRFCDGLERSDVPEQRESWGCANDEIEEIRLADNTDRVYAQALRDVIGKPLAEPTVVEYVGEMYDKTDYDPRHMLPFLADMFVSMPRTSNIAWYGVRPDMLRLFANLWTKLNFTGRILLDSPLLCEPGTNTLHVPALEALAGADAFLFDFGGLQPALQVSWASDPTVLRLHRSFNRVIGEEQRRCARGVPLRRIIALNAINNHYEGMVCSVVGASATPFGPRMRHGFVLPISPFVRSDMQRDIERDLQRDAQRREARWRRAWVRYFRRLQLIPILSSAAIRRWGPFGTVQRSITTLRYGGTAEFEIKLRALARAEASRIVELPLEQAAKRRAWSQYLRRLQLIVMLPSAATRRWGLFGAARRSITALRNGGMPEFKAKVRSLALMELARCQKAAEERRRQLKALEAATVKM